MYDTYIFVRVEKGDIYPLMMGQIQAKSPEEAIRAMNYYPWNKEDYEEMIVDVPDWEFESFEQMVFAYYGLVEGSCPYDLGNGQDGLRTMIVVVPDPSDPLTVSYVLPDWTNGTGRDTIPEDPEDEDAHL